MVDGIAAVELGSLLLDPTPEPVACEPDGWCAAPRARRRAAAGPRACATSLGEQLGLLRWPLRAAASPAARGAADAAGALRVTRALSHSLRAAPASALNRPLSPLRRLAWTERPLADLQVVKRAYGTTVNDVMLAAVAGGMRTYLIRRGEEPVALKAMVPVNVRSPDDVLGNHISFVFAELPCDEPQPLGRLYQVHAAMSQRKRDGEPEGADLALKAAARTPVGVQQRDLAARRQPAHLQPRGLEHPRARRAAVHARLPAAGHLPGRPARRPPRGLGRHDDGPRPRLLRRLRRPRGAARRRRCSRATSTTRSPS